jgi:hypothetical protein
VSQRDRRQEPYPWTWEPAATIGATLIAVVVSGTQLGRAAANLVAGSGLLFPSNLAGWVTSTPAVLTGNTSAGLSSADVQPAGPVLLGWCVGVSGTLLLALTVAVVVVGWRRFGPGGVQGVAGPDEVRATLGLRRLRRSSRLIRPDLHQHRAGGGE